MPRVDLNQFSKEELQEYMESGEIPPRFYNDNNLTKIIPSEAWWAGGVVTLVLLIFMWPILLVGAIAGVLATAFLICNVDDEE